MQAHMMVGGVAALRALVVVVSVVAMSAVGEGGKGGGGENEGGRAMEVAAAAVDARQDVWVAGCVELENATTCVKAASRKMHSDEGTDYEPSPEERALLRTLLNASPPFAPGSAANVSTECAAQSRLFLDALHRFELWALHMHDATVKPTAGMLMSGNVLLYGDYDACLLRAWEPSGAVQPRYCLARLQLELVDAAATEARSPRLHAAWQRFRSMDVLRSNIDDPGHRIPRISAVQWGLCVPAGCTSEDVHTALSSRLQSLASAAGMRLAVRVSRDDCQTTPSWCPPPSFAAGVLIFGTLIAVCIFATVKDFRRDQKPVTLSRGEQYLHAFSLRRNMNELLATKACGPHEVAGAHGVRAFNALLLLFAHKAMALFYLAFHDRTRMAENVGEMWSVLARGASLYTDPFLLLSGLLSTHALLRTLDRDGRLNWGREYASRILRLLPSLAALILLCNLVLPWLGSGPHWNLVVRKHADLCKTTWWRNMLFIHNYFGFENMCLTHTHHVGIDTQLFVLAPPLAWLLWRRPRAGVGATMALAAASAAYRYRVTRLRALTNFVHWGVSVSKLFESANFSYILPSHRATVYLLGVLMGYILLRIPRDLKLKEGLTAAGWTAAAALASASFLQPAFMGTPSYVYDAGDAARYSAFAPVGWCLSFCWLLLLAHLGRAGAIGRVLCWPGFQVTTRLSYAVYLVQFPVFFYNVGTSRTNVTYSIFLLFNMLELGSIVLASVTLTVFVDLPAQHVRSLLLQKKRLNHDTPVNAKKTPVAPKAMKAVD